MVPKTGIEPVREYKSRRILSPVRLPVPPLRHAPPSYVLLSQAVAHQVPSALKSLTSVFGMGTGGTLASSAPAMNVLEAIA